MFNEENEYMIMGNDLEEMHGKKVRLWNPIKNGYDDDKERALRHLEYDKVYTIKIYDQMSFRTYIVLEELPTEDFNSVLFEYL